MYNSRTFEKQKTTSVFPLIIKEIHETSRLYIHFPLHSKEIQSSPARNLPSPNITSHHPEVKHSPWKLMVGRWNILLTWALFRGHVDFRGCSCRCFFHLPSTLPPCAHPPGGTKPKSEEEINLFGFEKCLFLVKRVGDFQGLMFWRGVFKIWRSQANICHQSPQ